ncbi:ECF transporter S component [Candidatus Bipolaricaulota bacterium]|nr:ECF transporter S component [Candidatus Bipolaricaulota bacterium]
MNTTSARFRFDLRDLVLIALLSAVGGVLSTYIGYLGNLINRLFGVPFGAGQLIAGVHVLWPLLARAIIRKFGSGTMTGLIKGLVEFLSGGTHGIVIVLVSVIEGLFVDVGMSMSSRCSLGVMMLSGAVASATNVFLFQAIYFANIPLAVLLGMASLALISGAFFGGYLAWDLHGLLCASNLVRSDSDARQPTKKAVWRKHRITLLVILVGLAGAVYYYVEVYDPFAAPGAVSIEGSVLSPYVYRPSEWDGSVVTIIAELRGSTMTIPACEYSGPLLREIVVRATPEDRVTTLRVISSDGYEVELEWDAVLGDEELLLTLEDDSIRLVAGSYDGTYWVQRVRRIVVR